MKFKGKALSVFLELVEADKLPPKRKVYAEYKLRVRNQINDSHMEFTGRNRHIKLLDPIVLICSKPRIKTIIPARTN